MSVNDRVRQAVDAALARRNLEDCVGGTVSIVVKIDPAGCPKRIAIRTEVEEEVERTRPRALAAPSRSTPVDSMRDRAVS